MEGMEDIFLIGNTHYQIEGNKLPSKLQILKILFHNIRILKLDLRDSASLVYDEVIVFWRKAKIPVVVKSRCISIIENLYHEWRKLQRNATRQSDIQNQKQSLFSSHLNDLFDIAHQDVLTMVDDEVKSFLLNQRKPGRVGFIAGVEEIQSGSSQTNSHSQSQQTTSFSQGSLQRQPGHVGFSSSHEEIQSGSSQTNSKSQSQSTSSFSQESLQRDPSFVLDFEESPPSKRSRGTLDILTPKLCIMLDTCKISDRNAVNLLISLLQAVNLDANHYIVNRTSIKQKREMFRRKRAAEIQQRFKSTELRRLIVHWDGKHLPDITGRNFVERLPIIVSSDEESKILSIPQLENSTGNAIASAIFDALQEYGIGDLVIGSCCDTTPSNTGRINGAATLIEQLLERDLLLFPCRHHIFEVILRAVFETEIFNFSGPNVPLFVRFKKEWDTLDVTQFKSGIVDPIIYNILKDDILNIHEFVEKQLTVNHGRKDYLELLKLTSIFIGKIPDKVTFSVPGAMHQARWMAKAIYCLKIFLLRDTFQLKSKEEKGIGMICVFIVKIYVKIWFIASSSVKAPNCDFQLIKSLYNFQSINEKISRAALNKILNHLWYLNSQNCIMALFDDEVDIETKKKMVEKLSDTSNVADEDNEIWRCKKVVMSQSDVPKVLKQGLEQFINPHSINFFHHLQLDISWLKENPESWLENANYQKCMNIVKKLPVVNDIAERGVKLMTDYNNLFTKDEEQKQFVIQIVNDYRNKFKENTKISLLKPCD